jgi:beta,beta-carotene 9',10'-dioxygenase
MNVIPEFDSKAPFLFQPDFSQAKARIDGQVPPWLQGQLIRTCPAMFSTPTWKADHWFDGLGALYAFELSTLGVSFQQKLLGTRFAAAAQNGQAVATGFGTASTASLLQRVFRAQQMNGGDNTNVHCIRVGDELWALTEGQHINLVDAHTLECKGQVAWEDDGLQNLFTIAHPQFDPLTRRVVSMGTAFGRRSSLVLFEHGLTERRRREIARWTLPRIPYTHSFGLSDRHAVFINHPFTVAPLSLLLSGASFISHFAWTPNEGTRLGRIDRHTGQLFEHTCEPMFVFHTAHTFERPGETIMDVMAYEDVSIIGGLSVDSLQRQMPSSAQLKRITLTHGKGSARVETLCSSRMEFPVVDTRKVFGNEQHTLFGANPFINGAEPSRVFRVDLRQDTVKHFERPGFIFGEPVFVGRPGSSQEADGVVLSVGTHLDGGHSQLVILDATSMEPLATASIEVSVPLGFHGSFISAAQT